MLVKDINPEILSEIKGKFAEDTLLSENATKNSEAARYFPENRENEIRPPFFHDTDRIIHSKAYTRYIDKTQVFYLCENEDLTHRVLHVQLVAKIARTIGRILKCNEDLIEAIALGHDVGHTPFGHTGERFVSAYLKEKKEGSFCHNAQSFRLLHEIEKNENMHNINLCVQTLDGILCHNGEWLVEEYKSNSAKTKEMLVEEYQKCLIDETQTKKLRPMTLEGCIVRVSDVIAYIGRDIEDAIAVNLINREDIPADISEALGNSNKLIVNSLVLDIINNSYGKDSIAFSKDVFKALDKLKGWNYENIYNNPKKTSEDDKIHVMFNSVLDSLLNENLRGNIKQQYEKWKSEQNDEYFKTSSPARIAADYISGMTDDFLMTSYSELVVPKSFGFSFGR
ncbi:MAG: dNTP triphosphohydrolase [Candidatus Fibromonas sp.]|jgi:dGTPase|nr:dNTP triphosphohydrolase [Candidatus Fibromonas sp.]